MDLSMKKPLGKDNLAEAKELLILPTILLPPQHYPVENGRYILEGKAITTGFRETSLEEQYQIQTLVYRIEMRTLDLVQSEEWTIGEEGYQGNSILSIEMSKILYI